MRDLLISLLALCLLEACQQKLDTYSGENFIYFDQTSDSTFFSYAYVDGNIQNDSLWVWVRMSGQVSNNDRAIRLRVAETNGEEGIDFMPLKDSYTISAGSTVAVILVELLRPEHLKQEERYLVLELMESEDFKLKYPQQAINATSDIKYSKIRYKIVFSEMIDTEPKGWNETYFGKFSIEKLNKMCEELNMTRLMFNDYSYVNLRKEYIATKMVKVLKENPAYEADGSEMRMGDMYYN